jgi:starch-binding outer membrane protein, SusD/RagB family
MHSNRLRRLMRVTTLAAVMSTGVGLAACEEFLTADNPAAIPVERLEDTALVDLMANSVIATMQGPNLFWYVWMSGVFTDELVNLHVFAEEGLWDQRRLTPAGATYNTAFLYGPIGRGRWLADSIAGRIRAVYGDSALHDVRLARTYAIGGYNYILLAEGFCEAPISTSEQKYSAPYTPEELFEMAEAHFDSAIKIAAAAKTANAAVNTALGVRWSLAADSVRNLAYVGAARAALGRGDMAKAASFARQVTSLGGVTQFEYWAYYNSNTTLGLHNLMGERLSGGAGATSGTINFTPFIGLDDARVPHPMNATGQPLAEPAQNGSWVVPNSPPSFSTFNGTKTGADATFGTALRIASRLEAQYIIAEAEGATTENIAFVESRRTAFPSTTAPNPVTAANYQQSLKTQRSRDFYLDGHRIGDLRRYEKQQDIDLWPTGAYPRATNVTYGTQKCWPLTTAEITNNPLIPKPYTPPNGP